MLFSLVVLTFGASAAMADTKVISVAPPVGPVAAYAQSYLKNLKGTASFVPVKDCGTAMKMVEKDPDNTVVLLPHDLISTAVRLGETCWTKFQPKEVIMYAESHYLYCHLPNNTKKLTDAGTKMGRASMHPVKEWNADFNKRNNSQLESVPFPTSKHTLTALLAGDIDWGLIVKPLSIPARDAGKIVCPFSSDARDANSLHRTYGTIKADYPLANLLFTKSKDPKVVADLRQAAASKEFDTFHKKDQFTYWTSKATEKDVDRFLKAANDLVDMHNAGH